MSKNSPDRKSENLYPAFRKKVDTVLIQLAIYCKKNYPAFEPVFGEGFRSTARQKELYAQGRTTPGNKVTKCDGVKTPSNHQSALAFDLWLKKDGEIVWDAPKAIWDYYGHLCRWQGLVWGGDWTSIVDQPHCEWPTGDRKTYALARAWKVLKRLL